MKSSIYVPADYSKARDILQKFASKENEVASNFESTEISSTIYYVEKGSIRIFHDPSSEYSFITLELQGEGYEQGSTYTLTSDFDVDFYMKDEVLNRFRKSLIN